MNDKLRAALVKACLLHVTITYEHGAERRGYITFAHHIGGQPLIKRGFLDSHGAPLPTEGITRITWGETELYAAEQD